MFRIRIHQVPSRNPVSIQQVLITGIIISFAVGLGIGMRKTLRQRFAKMPHIYFGTTIWVFDWSELTFDERPMVELANNSRPYHRMNKLVLSSTIDVHSVTVDILGLWVV